VAAIQRWCEDGIGGSGGGTEEVGAGWVWSGVVCCAEATCGASTAKAKAAQPSAIRYMKFPSPDANGASNNLGEDRPAKRARAPATAVGSTEQLHGLSLRRGAAGKRFRRRRA
jgi:hypothetical protein